MGDAGTKIQVVIDSLASLQECFNQHLSNQALFVEARNCSLERNQQVQIELSLPSLKQRFDLAGTVVMIQEQEEGRQAVGFALAEVSNEVDITVQELLKSWSQDSAGADIPIAMPLTKIESGIAGAAEETDVSMKARQSEARKLFQKGREKIQTGDLKTAIQFVQQAVNKDARNQQYKQVLRELRKKVR